MANEFYNHTSGVPESISRATSPLMRNEFDLIAAGFDDIPTKAELATNSVGFASDTGGVNAFVLSGVPAVTALTDGMEFRFRAANANTGPATINVNGLGIKAVVRSDGTALGVGDIFAGQAVTLTYDEDNDRFQYFTSGAASATSAANSAAAAAISAGAAATSAGAAAGAASSALGSANSAAASATTALGYRDDCQDLRDEMVSMTSGVTSVAGRSGAVVLTAADISNSTTTGRSLMTAADAAAARTTLGVTPASGPTFTGLINLNGSVRRPANAVGALDIDCSVGSAFTKAISGNSTFTFSNVPASGTDYTLTLTLTHSAGTITWPSTVRWPGGTAPTLTTSRVHIFFFKTSDGGANWRGAVLSNYTA